MSKSNFIPLFFLLLFFFSIFGAYLINTDGFSIETRYVSINAETHSIQGLLYKPKAVNEQNPVPAVVLAHGITNSKEVMSGFALEIAKHNIVALTIDETAHGNSGGNLIRDWNAEEPTLGLKYAINWIREQNYIIPDKIGVIGHSMGAEAAKYASFNNENIISTILVGGGLNDIININNLDLDSTNPKNLLFIIGKFDVLYNIETIKSSENIQSIFNTSSTIEDNKLYGNFQDQNARKLVLTQNTHLFEIIDPNVNQIVLEWLHDSFSVDFKRTFNFSYLLRDFLLGFSFFLILPLINYFLSNLNLKFKLNKEENYIETLGKHPSLVLTSIIYGLIGIVLFYPSQIIGSVINFPPLEFGSAFCIWMASTALVSYFLLFIWGGERNKKYFQNDLKFIKKNISKNTLSISILIFTLLYILSVLMEYLFQMNIKIIIPIFNEIGNEIRIAFFITIIPFTLVYFLFENNLFFFRAQINDKSTFNGLIKLLLGKTTPFIVVLGLLYFPVLIFSVVLIPGLIGFLIEFLVPIVPLFIFTTTINWIFYKFRNEYVTGAILNSLLVAWVMASLFPVI